MEHDPGRRVRKRTLAEEVTELEGSLLARSLLHDLQEQDEGQIDRFMKSLEKEEGSHEQGAE